MPGPIIGWASFKSGTNRASQGIAECERSLGLDPNMARAHALMGLGKNFSGRPDETEPHVKEALRLSPRDDFASQWMLTAGAAKLHLRADEEAVAWLRRSIESDRNWPLAHFFLAAALANLGRLEEARAAAQAGLALDPTFTIRRFHLGAATDNPRFHFDARALLCRHAQGRSPRAMTAARRLAAILAADVVGYSRLMGEDEAGTAIAVREHRDAARPIVAGLGGPHRQDDGRRPAAGIPLRRRRGRVRDRDPEADGRAQRRRCRRRSASSIASASISATC